MPTDPSHPRPDQQNCCGDGKEKKLYCPSAHPKLKGSMIVGVVRGHGENAAVSYLPHPKKVSDNTKFAFASGAISPTAIFRFAAPCVREECTNWSGSNCKVVETLVQIVPAKQETVSTLPACNIRAVCRWFEEERAAACARCPEVVTYDPVLHERLNEHPISPPESVP